MGWMIGGSSPSRSQVFFFFTTTSTLALGPTQPPIQWVPGALSLGVKQPWHEVIPPLPNTPSWCGAQLKHGDNFTFTFQNQDNPVSEVIGYRF
jgi:hypothetical protein